MHIHLSLDHIPTWTICCRVSAGGRQGAIHSCGGVGKGGHASPTGYCTAQSEWYHRSTLQHTPQGSALASGHEVRNHYCKLPCCTMCSVWLQISGELAQLWQSSEADCGHRFQWVKAAAFEPQLFVLLRVSICCLDGLSCLVASCVMSHLIYVSLTPAACC